MPSPSGVPDTRPIGSCWHPSAGPRQAPPPWPPRSPHPAPWWRAGRSSRHVCLCDPSVPSARAGWRPVTAAIVFPVCRRSCRCRSGKPVSFRDLIQISRKLDRRSRPPFGPAKTRLSGSWPTNRSRTAWPQRPHLAAIRSAGERAFRARVRSGGEEPRRPPRCTGESRTGRSGPLCGPRAGGDHDAMTPKVHPVECRACSRFDWWMPESQS